MSIASEINRIKTNISNAYDKCEAKGATIPTDKNSANLATTIDSITGGSAPSIAIKSPYADDNGKFVKPAEWDDIESIPLSETDQVLYLLYDNTLDFSWCSITVTCNTGSSICDYGRVVNGQFQVLDTETKASKSSYQRALSVDFPNEDYIVLRIRPASTNNITTISVVNWTYNGNTLPSVEQPILMRYGSLPKATSINFATRYIVSDNIMNCTSLTSLANFSQDCYRLVRHRHTGWNTSNVTTSASMFSGCYCLTDMDTDFIGWFGGGKNTTTNFMFEYVPVKTINVSLWNMSNTTSIQYMFRECNNLEKIIGIENWYLPKIGATNVGFFSGCRKLKQESGVLDLSNWKHGESNTTDKSFAAFFNGCARLEKIVLTGWNMNYATTLANMFNECLSLREVELPSIGSKLTNIGNMFIMATNITDIDFSNMTYGQITSSMAPFGNAKSLINFIPPSVINANITLSDCSLLSHDSLVAVLNSLSTLTTAKTLTLGKINLSKLSDEEKAIATNKGWSLA